MNIDIIAPGIVLKCELLLLMQSVRGRWIAYCWTHWTKSFDFQQIGRHKLTDWDGERSLESCLGKLLVTGEQKIDFTALWVKMSPLSSANVAVGLISLFLGWITLWLSKFNLVLESSV